MKVVCISSFLLFSSISWYAFTTVFFNHSLVEHLEVLVVKIKVALNNTCIGFCMIISFHFAGINA